MEIFDNTGSLVVQRHDDYVYSDSALLHVQLESQSPGSYFEEVRVYKYNPVEPVLSIQPLNTKSSYLTPDNFKAVTGNKNPIKKEPYNFQVSFNVHRSSYLKSTKFETKCMDM